MLTAILIAASLASGVHPGAAPVPFTITDHGHGALSALGQDLHDGESFTVGGILHTVTGARTAGTSTSFTAVPALPASDDGKYVPAALLD